MKKTFGLSWMGYLLISIALAGCTSVEKTVITASNLPSIQGTYEGWTEFGIGQYRPVMTQVHISNNTVPIQGRVTFNNLPEDLARVIPADQKTAGNNVTINFSDGKISQNGTVISQIGQNTLELTYFEGEKPKIRGWFYYWMFKGSFEVTKK